MKTFRVVVLMLLAMVASVAGAQTCSGGRDLGVMGPPDLEYLGNSFASAGNYTDCYTFSVGSSASSIGLVFDFFDPRINISSVSLFGGSSLINSVANPLVFSFGALAGGVSYTLAVTSAVSKYVTAFAPAGYVGVFHTYAAPVPEPSSYALLALGLIGVGAAVRRRAR